MAIVMALGMGMAIAMDGITMGITMVMEIGMGIRMEIGMGMTIVMGHRLVCVRGVNNNNKMWSQACAELVRSQCEYNL